MGICSHAIRRSGHWKIFPVPWISIWARHLFLQTRDWWHPLCMIFDWSWIWNWSKVKFKYWIWIWSKISLYLLPKLWDFWITQKAINQNDHSDSKSWTYTLPLQAYIIDYRNARPTLQYIMAWFKIMMKLQNSLCKNMTTLLSLQKKQGSIQSIKWWLESPPGGCLFHVICYKLSHKWTTLAL